MAHCGMPTLKLDRQNHYGKKSNAGNISAVILEAAEERQGSDPDIDRELTPTNRYFGLLEETHKGADLIKWFEDKADAYRVIDKNGHEKKLRSDAGIAFAGIIKPEADYINAMPRAEQERYLTDSALVLGDILKAHKLKMVAMVWHFDEGATHAHYYGYDPEYKLGKKLGLPLFNALNNEFPEKMREKGWDIENLKGYDIERVKEMSQEDRKAYDEQYKAEKKEKKHGLSSKQYKAQQDVIQAEKRIAEAEKAEEKSRQAVNLGNIALQKREQAVSIRENTISTREQDISSQKNELRAEGARLSKGWDELEEAERAFQKRRDHFENEVRAEAKRQVKELVPEQAEKVRDKILRENTWEFDMPFLLQVVCATVEAFAKLVEKSFGIKIMHRVEPWLDKNYEPFTEQIVQDVIAKNIEQSTENELGIDEDPGMDPW